MKKNKQLFIGVSLLFLSGVSISQDIIIKKDSSDSGNLCKYNSLNIDEMGKMSLILRDYQNCINTLTGTIVDTPENPKKECTYNNARYTDGTRLTFYKSENDCSDPAQVTCSNGSFSPPSGYAVTSCTPISSEDSNWPIKDPIDYGINITSEGLKGSPENGGKYTVYTIGGGRVVAAPACANGKGLNACRRPSDWFPGARTDEVYAVREKREDNPGNLSLEFQLNVHAPEIYQSLYHVTISGNPGQMEGSTFIGPGCVRPADGRVNFSIKIINTKTYNKFKDNLTTRTCYVPDGARYYINIRADNPKCDRTGEIDEDFVDRNGKKTVKIGPCNSYYEKH